MRAFPDPDAASVTVTPGTRLLKASRTVTVIAAALEPVLDVIVWGAVTTLEIVAEGAAGATVKPIDEADGSAAVAAVRVYPAAARSMLRPVKPATPLTAPTRLVPGSGPPPGFVAMAIPMESGNDVTVLPN